MSHQHQSGEAKRPHRRRESRSRGVEPVYLTRAQRIYLAGLLNLRIDRLRETDSDEFASRAMIQASEDHIRKIKSILRRIREARIDG